MELSFIVQLRVDTYAGGKVKIYVSVVGELGNPVSAVLRLSDAQVCLIQTSTMTSYLSVLPYRLGAPLIIPTYFKGVLFYTVTYLSKPLRPNFRLCIKPQTSAISK